MRLVTTAALFALAILAVPFAQASDASPVGLWKAIDDTTGKPSALIRITEERGELRGKIEQLFRAPGEDPNPKCTLCSDARKDQPILGMTIVSGLKKDGDEYKDGEILDPNNGKIYKSKLSVHDGGKKVEVRGYVGVPMFGRSQVWLRQE
ncbi:DUF2147 domain-containing protein [Massilia sp. TW-1]|uniref:DUF2147 domain-containing protein n=1 Tax=Telluria antibiotica TaxID=2717319 RepID=A0ABX0PGM9_9BURK|nr:DUF2147 domain-containing protein [Telluria antibiotica]NIA56600.1 DUF2147 domain-containing protein [Telluria antibiotica]